jgi:predicted phage tail component-like protein
MTIRESNSFTYAGRSSDEFGIINVNISTGMQSEPFASNRSIREQKVNGNDRPYFMGIEKQPLELTLSFAFENETTQDQLREVARWLLGPKYYVPLVFEDIDPDRIFYGLFIDSPEYIHNCAGNGYLQLNFRCADAYSYTGVYTQIYDLSTNPVDGTVITFDNFGDDECKPIIKIYKVGDGDVSIFNQSNGNAEMTIKNLVDDETCTVDCENRIIISDIPLTLHYNDLQGDYLTLPIYNNYLLVKGTCQLEFTYQLKRLQ